METLLGMLLSTGGRVCSSKETLSLGIFPCFYRESLEATEKAFVVSSPSPCLAMTLSLHHFYFFFFPFPLFFAAFPALSPLAPAGMLP